MKLKLHSFIVVSLLVLTACISADEQIPVDVKILATNNHCGPNMGMQLIQHKEEWLSTTLFNLSDIDWQQEQALVVRMGTQPNTAYGLSYDGGAYIRAETLHIPLVWHQPDPQGIYPQMIVEPCLLLSIPNSGYQDIQVLDQHNSLKFELKRPE